MDRERLLRISRAWKSGMDTSMIGLRFGWKRPSSVIVDLRHRYPELFPYRSGKRERLDESIKERGLTLPRMGQWEKKKNGNKHVTVNR